MAEIYDHIVTFIVAGHETTAGAVAFALYELARDQETQSKLRDEILRFPAEVGYDELSNADTFPLLDAVCKEM
jgi:cytochrome P450